MEIKSNKNNMQSLILEILQGKKAIEIESLVSIVKDKIGIQADKKTKPEYLIRRTIKNLEDLNCLKKINTDQSTFVQITKDGKHKLAQIYLCSESHIVPTKWDGNWRIVILDISEKDKQTRNALRYILKKANFVCLKNSVWISPYAFETFLSQMKENLGLYDEMMIFVTNQIDKKTEEVIKERIFRNITK